MFKERVFPEVVILLYHFVQFFVGGDVSGCVKKFAADVVSDSGVEECGKAFHREDGEVGVVENSVQCLLDEVVGGESLVEFHAPLSDVLTGEYGEGGSGLKFGPVVESESLYGDV